MFGNAQVKAAGSIEIAGFGRRFSGALPAGEVTHRFRGGIWQTEVEFGPASPGAAV